MEDSAKQKSYKSQRAEVSRYAKEDILQYSHIIEMYRERLLKQEYINAAHAFIDGGGEVWVRLGDGGDGKTALLLTFDYNGNMILQGVPRPINPTAWQLAYILTRSGANGEGLQSCIEAYKTNHNLTFKK